MLVFYNTLDLCSRYKDLPGVDLLNDHRKVIRSNNSMFFDRSETVNIPIKIKNMFPIPKLDQNFKETYEEICNRTVVKIIERAITENKKIRIMWSGGIDSTVILASFLKLGYRESIEVAISIESISENYNFYKNHLLNKVKIIPSADIKSLATNDCLLIGGEYNDQLFGSNLLSRFVKYYNVEDLHEKFDIDKLRTIFSSDESANADQWIENYLLISKSAPVEIKSNLDFHWWINFSCKWQGIYYRLSSYFSQNFDLKNYYHFFQGEEFQQWSLNNRHIKFHKWSDYKKTCKDLIWEFDKDDLYRDKKIKLESLNFIAQKNSFTNYIDIQGNHYFDLPKDLAY
jgi:hypothetical protein